MNNLTIGKYFHVIGKRWLRDIEIFQNIAGANDAAIQAQGLAAGVRQSLTVAFCILIVGLVLSFFIKRNTNEEAENDFDEEDISA